MNQTQITWMYLLFFSVIVFPTSAAFHSLRYVSTAITRGTHFPEYTVLGFVDGELFEYYDSNIMRMIPKTEWIKKNKGDDYWDSESLVFKDEQEWSLYNMAKTMKRHNNTEGIHTWQWTYGCELHNNNITRVFSNFAYDGHDYIRLDINTGKFTAHINAFLLNWSEALADHCKQYLEKECFEELKTFLGFIETSLEREVRPKTDLFQKDSSSPVVCHATGFFPKAVMMSWQKNGEDVHEDVELRETVPNEDGSFQKRSVLTVSPEELKKNKYTCVIQHSSLEEKEIHLSDIRVLTDGGSVGVIIGAVVAALLLVLVGCVGFFIWKKKSDFQTVSSVHTECETSSEEM